MQNKLKIFKTHYFTIYRLFQKHEFIKIEMSSYPKTLVLLLEIDFATLRTNQTPLGYLST